MSAASCRPGGKERRLGWYLWYNTGPKRIWTSPEIGEAPGLSAPTLVPKHSRYGPALAAPEPLQSYASFRSLLKCHLLRLPGPIISPTRN